VRVAVFWCVGSVNYLHTEIFHAIRLIWLGASSVYFMLKTHHNIITKVLAGQGGSSCIVRLFLRCVFVVCDFGAFWGGI